MTREPDYSLHRPDHRLNLYRGQVGRLLRGNDEVGLLLVEVQPYSVKSLGHLWWKRYDVLWKWSIVDGVHADSLNSEVTEDEELRDLDAGCFDYYGETLGVVWVDERESAELRSSQFDR